jgi:hypothetical protein
MIIIKLSQVLTADSRHYLINDFPALHVLIPLLPSLAQTKEGGEKAFSPSLRSTTLYIHLVKTGRPYWGSLSYYY